MIEINLNRKDVTHSFVVGLVISVFVVVFGLCMMQAHHTSFLESRIDKLEKHLQPLDR